MFRYVKFKLCPDKICCEILVKNDESTERESTWQIISETEKESPSGDVVLSQLFKSSAKVSSRMKGDDSKLTGR